MIALSAATTRTDWAPLAFALMSSHPQWALEAGEQPSSAFVKPLNSGFAGYLKRTLHRLGPVFADRHRTISCTGDTAAALIAYIHNNPVRAGVVEDPRHSYWTSHPMVRPATMGEHRPRTGALWFLELSTLR